MKWQPIETAPKDGSLQILSDANGRVFFGAYIVIPFKEYRDVDGFYIGQQDPDEYWMDQENGDSVYPTHWMPLPAPPKEQK